MIAAGTFEEMLERPDAYPDWWQEVDADEEIRPEPTVLDRLLDATLPANRLTLTVEDMAGILGLGRTAAYEAVRRGDLPSRRINGRIVVPVPSLLEWLGV